MMHSDGLNKVMEESAELIQVAAKWQSCEVHGLGRTYYDGVDIKTRVEEEIADVLAACEFLIIAKNLDSCAIETRKTTKLRFFKDCCDES